MKVGLQLPSFTWPGGPEAIGPTLGRVVRAADDSGGPWFWGNTAYGLTYGWRYDPVWPFDRDLFSRADRIDNALGVNVVN